MDEFKPVPYCDVELLCVDCLQVTDGHATRIGISLALDDDQVDIALSPADATRLVLAVARALYDLTAGEG